jgi:hypothetical protein
LEKLEVKYLVEDALNREEVKKVVPRAMAKGE